MGNLTKKDFIKFANELSQIENDITRKDMIKSHINVLRGTNPRFDPERFERFIEDKIFERKMGFKRK